MKKITYPNKINQASIADRNKQVTAEDLNEIKEVVNYNADLINSNILFDFRNLLLNPNIYFNASVPLFIVNDLSFLPKRNVNISVGANYYFDNNLSNSVGLTVYLEKANGDRLYFCQERLNNLAGKEWHTINKTFNVNVTSEYVKLYVFFTYPPREPAEPDFVKNMYLALSSNTLHI